MQENLSNLLEKIYISSPGACDTAVSPSLWHRDPSSVKTCVTKTGDRHGRGEPQSCSHDCTAICLMNPPAQDKERPIYKKLHQASVESSKTTWHTSGPLADLPLSPDKVEQNKILEERVGKERKEREQLTRQKASEKSLWLLYGTTLRIMFPYCIMLNPLFFLYFFEETLHFRLVALVSQSGFWTIGSIGMLPTWLQRTLTRPDKCVSARSVSSRSGNLIPAPSDHKCVH